MEIQDTPSKFQHKKAYLANLNLWKRSLRSSVKWIKHHKGEVLWAAAFAVIIAWIISPPSPRPYTIYIIADARTDPETMEEFDQLKQNSSAGALSIGDVPVQIKVEKLEDHETTTAVAKAKELVNRRDTLLVIGHMSSPLIEESLLTLFQADPPVPLLSTTASAEDLLSKCRIIGDPCYRDGWFAPLLQLSPTNKEQGLAAIRFAAQNHKKRFLIVTEHAPDRDDYTKKLVNSYDNAIDEENNQFGHGRNALMIVGKFKLDRIPNKTALRKLAPDCVLYAGELGTAHGLLNAFPNPQPMVIFSDSILESRGSDNALAEFTPARFTYQTDASDYNNHTNIYGRDAYWIARQLIDDVNTRGGDWRYWIKSILHFHSVEDARRNLVRIMKDNSNSRTWYSGFPAQVGDAKNRGTTYAFNHERRLDGMFHVWQLNPKSEIAGRKMEDIDNWHPPKYAEGEHSSSLVKNVKDNKK